MRPYARWRALRRGEQLDTVKSTVVVAAAAAALRLLGVERTLRLAGRPVRALRPAPVAQGRASNVIGDLVTAVDRAGRYVPGGTCLTKSLALAWMLRRNGVAATVRIGVSTVEGFAAHAWVECDGAALNGASHHDGYSVLVG